MLRRTLIQLFDRCYHRRSRILSLSLEYGSTIEFPYTSSRRYPQYQRYTAVVIESFPSSTRYDSQFVIASLQFPGLRPNAIICARPDANEKRRHAKLTGISVSTARLDQIYMSNCPPLKSSLGPVFTTPLIRSFLRCWSGTSNGSSQSCCFLSSSSISS